MRNLQRPIEPGTSHAKAQRAQRKTLGVLLESLAAWREARIFLQPLRARLRLGFRGTAAGSGIRFSRQACALIAATLGLPGVALPGQASADQAAHEAYEGRIRSLEQRVAALERLLAVRFPEEALAAGGPGAPASSAAVPAVPVKRLRYEPPPELVPEIGKIGAQIGLTLAGSANPFKLDPGSFAGGFIDLPLLDRPDWMRGKLSYEISVGLSQSQTTFQTTSNVAQVANLVVLDTLNPNGGLQNVSAAVSGTGAAPFPVTSSTLTRLRLLQVVPFSVKYSSTLLDRWRLRPYGVLGFGVFVTIHNQNPARGTPANYGVRPNADLPPAILTTLNQIFGGQAPFGGPLVAGQISQSPELESRGLPGGHGNIDLGLHSGGGIEFRISRSLALGFDARYNRIAGSNGGFKTFGSRIGVYF